MKSCPFCATEMQRSLTVCPHCRQSTAPSGTPEALKEIGRSRRARQRMQVVAALPFLCLVFFSLCDCLWERRTEDAGRPAGSGNSMPAEGARISVPVGTEGRLIGGKDPGGCPVCRTLEDLVSLHDAVSSNDDASRGMLISTGRVWLAPSGSRVRVIEVRAYARKVRFKDGADGWVFADAIDSSVPAGPPAP